MNTIQTTKNLFIQAPLFSGSPEKTHYLWENLVIEKRISINWLYKLYKGSILGAFWSVLSSPVI